MSERARRPGESFTDYLLRLDKLAQAATTQDDRLEAALEAANIDPYHFIDWLKRKLKDAT